MEIHVSKQGSDSNNGSIDAPFLTIDKAAKTAVAGDTVIIHEGVYRECVRPVNGGTSNLNRITYEAVMGEHVVIKGSEIVHNWQHVHGDMWLTMVNDSFFGDYNPYEKPMNGDWLVAPRDYSVHTGEIYLNGKSLYEAESKEAVYNPAIRPVSTMNTWQRREEKNLEPERTVYQWFTEHEPGRTTIYANFQGADPTKECVEINVRKSCFVPVRTGINYITVRGIEFAQAATPWAPPTSYQEAMLFTNWSKGWIIENNIFHDSKCSAISLGKENTTGDNESLKWHRKPGYQTQMESVFRAKSIGWDKEHVGSHIIRNNKIYDCGQNGIVGHMGCIFSEIYENEIYNIAVKHEFYGYEIAGIKLHAAIDVQIHNNYIHNCTLGTWLDWQAQGARVSSNIYDDNDRDLMFEVTHGPCTVDSNIFTAKATLDNAAQGTAYIHNLCCGFMHKHSEMLRGTPYHVPHSTDMLGTTLVYGGDDRWYQNIFTGELEPERDYGTACYDGSPASLKEYIELIKKDVEENGNGDMKQFNKYLQPVYIDGNVYLSGTKAYNREKNNYCSSTNPDAHIVTEGNEVFLEITLPDEIFRVKSEIISSEKLETPRITEAEFENPDGSPIIFNSDFLGKMRDESPTPGPIENVKAGYNKIKIWTR